MHIIRVAPLAALPNTVPRVLDYFWTVPLPQGSAVRITVGRRQMPALVLESLDLRQAKLAVKGASFALKRLVAVIDASVRISATQLALARWMAQQYACPLGLCLKTVLPPALLTAGKAMPPPAPPRATGPHSRKPDFMLTDPAAAVRRITMLAAKKGQLLVVVPEIRLAEQLGKRLAKQQPAIVHSGLGIRRMREFFRGIADGTIRFVIGTRATLFLPWSDLRHIVVEDPLHEAYKSDMAPRYAAPDVARHLAELHDACLTFLSPALSVVNRYLVDRNAVRFTDQRKRWPVVVSVALEQERQLGNMNILSRRAQEELLDAVKRREPVLLYSGRRALATMLRCRHCSASVQCETCRIPLRPHHTTEDMLVCYHCAAYREVPRQCPACHRGPLRPAGFAGSQRIAKATAAILEGAGISPGDIPILDSDLVRTPEHEREVFRACDAMVAPILVASQMVLGHRYERTFGTVIVPQADALMTSPDFRAQERLIWQLEKLADFGPRVMVLQSWAEWSPLHLAAKRDWDSFYRQELALRKALRWPPFCRLVRLSLSHPSQSAVVRSAAVAADRLRRAIAHLHLTGTELLGPTPALAGRAGGRWAQHMILKTTLTGPDLGRLLAYAPAGLVIDIDPRSIA